MTLKEKLAEESANKTEGFTDYHEAHVQGYLAGFEKAREMAHEWFLEESLATTIMDLGEEEVE